MFTKYIHFYKYFQSSGLIAASWMCSECPGPTYFALLSFRPNTGLFLNWHRSLFEGLVRLTDRSSKPGVFPDHHVYVNLYSMSARWFLESWRGKARVTHSKCHYGADKPSALNMGNSPGEQQIEWMWGRRGSRESFRKGPVTEVLEFVHYTNFTFVDRWSSKCPVLFFFFLCGRYGKKRPIP